jgi:hypothetical protein
MNAAEYPGCDVSRRDKFHIIQKRSFPSVDGEFAGRQENGIIKNDCCGARESERTGCYKDRVIECRTDLACYGESARGRKSYVIKCDGKGAGVT